MHIAEEIELEFLKIQRQKAHEIFYTVWFKVSAFSVATHIMYWLKVPKCEIFHLFDFNDFYGIKSL